MPILYLAVMLPYLALVGRRVLAACPVTRRSFPGPRPVAE